MAPKKDKGKDGAGQKGGAVFTEVEKTFLELQITECNRIISRLRASVDDYEHRNEELQQAYEKLDEDRADIISYLKKNLNLKNEENLELKDKVKGLEETRQIENAQFKEKVEELEKNFTLMKDQLTSENKLLGGKLNTLEEFRAIRDDLMMKYEKQEQAFKDQEMKYKRIIYDTEKKFVVGKDKLKREMEGRLLQLAQDFQDATEKRIAASTLRVIRENIALNNALDSLLNTQAKLSNQNEKFKEYKRTARVAKELAEEERDKAINKSLVQLKIIDQLTFTFQEMDKEKFQFTKKTQDLEVLEIKIQKLTKENENLSHRVQVLQQHLHFKMTDGNKNEAESLLIKKECSKIRSILKEAAVAIQAALKHDKWATDDPKHVMVDRNFLLSRLLEIISQYHDIQTTDSADSFMSFGEVYNEGDLGFIPRRITKKPVDKIRPSSTRSKDGIKSELSSTTISVSTSTLGSVKTIPSVKILPKAPESEIVTEESNKSLISTKTKETSSEKDIPVSLTSIEKELEASKLAIQRSILKDLASSQAVLRSQLKMSDEETTRKMSDEESVKSQVNFEDQQLEDQDNVETEQIEGLIKEEDENKTEEIEDVKE